MFVLHTTHSTTHSHTDTQTYTCLMDVRNDKSDMHDVHICAHVHTLHTAILAPAPFAQCRTAAAGPKRFGREARHRTRMADSGAARPDEAARAARMVDSGAARPDCTVADLHRHSERDK